VRWETLGGPLAALYIGNSVSIFSQSESIAMPQTMVPCRRGGVAWSEAVPMTLLLDAWLAGTACVCTVRATAIVAIKAAATAAERNVILRDIIAVPRGLRHSYQANNKIIAVHKIALAHN
jgi:hypothetical protein